MGRDPQFYISLMSDGLAVETLQNDYIDGLVADNMHNTMAIVAGYRVTIDLAGYAYSTAGSSLMIYREWTRNNEDTTRKFIKASIEAVFLLVTNKEVAFKKLRKWYRLTDPELLEFFYEGSIRMPRKPCPLPWKAYKG